jgi:hypothetical protein
MEYFEEIMAEYIFRAYWGLRDCEFVLRLCRMSTLHVPTCL